MLQRLLLIFLAADLSFTVPYYHMKVTGKLTSRHRILSHPSRAAFSKVSTITSGQTHIRLSSLLQIGSGPTTSMRAILQTSQLLIAGVLILITILTMSLLEPRKYLPPTIDSFIQSSHELLWNNYNDQMRTVPLIPRVEVFLVHWEDPLLLAYAVRFYRERLGMAGVRITVYDNESKDGSMELAKALGCRVVPFATEGQLQDQAYIDIKSNCWKQSEADWAIIVDLDEWLDVRPKDLDLYEAAGVSVVNTDGVTLVWQNDTTDLNEPPLRISGGVSGWNGKPCMFDRRKITVYTVDPGAHNSRCEGEVKWLREANPPIPAPQLYHIKYFSETYLVERHRKYSARLSEHNLKMGWGGQYVDEALLDIPRRFSEERKNAVPVSNLNGSSIFRRGEAGSPL